MSNSDRTPMRRYEAALVLSRFVRQEAARTRSDMGFGWVGTDPSPSTYQQLRGAFVQSQRTGNPLPVSNMFCDSTIFLTPGDNVAFRYWHDTSHVRLGSRSNTPTRWSLPSGISNKTRPCGPWPGFAAVRAPDRRSGWPAAPKRAGRPVSV